MSKPSERLAGVVDAVVNVYFNGKTFLGVPKKGASGTFMCAKSTGLDAFVTELVKDTLVEVTGPDISTCSFSAKAKAKLRQAVLLLQEAERIAGDYLILEAYDSLTGCGDC